MPNLEHVKISVLMPIYDTNPQYLREAIESILNQTFSVFEFLILNDSPDNKKLEKIVRSYQDSRIIYFENEKNIGISASRNKLLNMARGEYIAVMDHDDISLPTRLEEELRVLDADPFLGVVSCFFQRIGEKNIVERPVETTGIVKGLIAGGCYLLHPASMIRKSVLDDLCLSYEEEFSPAEDFALWCRLVGKTKFYNIPKKLFLYREHDANTSARQRKKMQMASQKVCEFVRKEHPEMWDEIKGSVRYFIKIFGIPFIKVKKRGLLTKYYLLGFIPLFSVQEKGIVSV